VARHHRKWFDDHESKLEEIQTLVEREWNDADWTTGLTDGMERAVMVASMSAVA